MINTVFMGACLLGAIRTVAVAADMGTPRMIDITADSNNRFKVPRQKEPVITMNVNEVAVLGSARVASGTKRMAPYIPLPSMP